MSDTETNSTPTVDNREPYTIPHGVHQITHCVGYMQYRAEPKQVEAPPREGVVVGGLLLSTLNVAE